MVVGWPGPVAVWVGYTATPTASQGPARAPDLLCFPSPLLGERKQVRGAMTRGSGPGHPHPGPLPHREKGEMGPGERCWNHTISWVHSKRAACRRGADALYPGGATVPLGGGAGQGAPMIVRVRVPATTANLGSGFDTLGMALGLQNDVELEATGTAKSWAYRSPPARPRPRGIPSSPTWSRAASAGSAW